MGYYELGRCIANFYIIEMYKNEKRKVLLISIN